MKYGRHLLARFSRVSSGAADAAMRPQRAWAIILTAAACSLFLLVAFSTYFFVYVAQEHGVVITDEEAHVERIDDERLARILETFDERADAFAELKQTPPAIIDPSL